MARLLLLLVLMYIVAGALRRFLGGLADGLGGTTSRSRTTPATNLVRDPVCGVFVVPSHALTASKGSETRFFCSDKCRQAWVSR